MSVSVDLVSGEVKLGPEEELRGLRYRLRKLATKIEEAPEGPKKAELRREYRELQKRLGENPGGDVPVRDTYPGDELAAFVDGLVAEFAGKEAPSGAVDLAEERTFDPGAGLDGFLERIAAQDDVALPESVREDAELQEALRAQAHEDHFGEADGDGLSDEAMWAEYRRITGEEG